MASSNNLLAMHVASLVLSLSIVIFTAFDWGHLSCFCGPIFGIATFTFHLTVLLISQTRPKKRPVESFACAVTAGLLAFAWLVTYFAMMAVQDARVGAPKIIELAGLHLRPSRCATLKLQLFAVPWQWTMLGTLAVKTAFLRLEREEEEQRVGKLPMYHSDTLQPTSPMFPAAASDALP